MTASELISNANHMLRAIVILIFMAFMCVLGAAVLFLLLILTVGYWFVVTPWNLITGGNRKKQQE